MEKNVELDANLIIEMLQRRIGQLVAQYETDIAMRDALIQQLQNQVKEE